MTPQSSPTTVSLRALLIALIVASVAWTTREVTSFGFLPLVDDDVNIFYNPHLGAPDASRIHWMASDFSYVHRYMPLGWLGFSLVYGVSGLDPWGYHAAGMALHILNALLVFVILDLLLRRFQGSVPERERILSAGLGSLLWALHPLRVETTSWCSGLLYSQAGFLALLCVWGRLAELRALAEGQRGRAALFLGLGWLAYLASMLTYPVALFLPFALMVVDRAWFTASTAPTAAARVTARNGSVLYCLTAVTGLVLTVYARGTALASWLKAPTISQFGPVDRVVQASYVAVVDLWRTVWTGDIRWMPTTLFDAGATGRLGGGAVAILAVITGFAWSRRKTAPYIPACWVCYLILVTPNLGLSEHPHTIADRYLYFTGIVFSCALAFALARVRSRAVFGFCAGLCAAAGVACAVVSVDLARTWRSTDAFQARMMKNPDPDLNHITAARAGKLLFLEGDVKGGREIVAKELERAPSVGGVLLTWRQVAPGAPLSPNVASTRLQEWPAAPFAFAHLQIAHDQLAVGRVHDALLHLDAALAISPDFTEARFRRGILLVERGKADQALHDWLFVRRSTARDPTSGQGQLTFLTGRLEEAYAFAGNERLVADMKKAAHGSE